MEKIAALPSILAFALILPVHAHLEVNSLSIKGGESFTSGQSVTITWKMAHAHTYYHFIYFKSDSQAAWNIIDSVKGQSGNLNYSYSWSAPQITSRNAQIRIFLPEFSKTPSEKADQFTLISKPFSISLTTAAFPRMHESSPKHLLSAQRDRLFDLKGRVSGFEAHARSTEFLVANRRTVVSNRDGFGSHAP